MNARHSPERIAACTGATPAPYTRGTINRIRGMVRLCGPQAIATELGWTIGMLDDICRKHGIRVLASDVAAVVPQLVALPASDPLSAIGVLWDEKLRRLSTSGAYITLPEKQAELFTSLLRTLKTKEFMPGEALPGSKRSRWTLLNYLDKKIAGFGLEMQSRGGSGGGYRLAIVGRGKP